MTNSLGTGRGPITPSGETLTVAEVLDRAADLIEPEGAWTQRAVGRDKKDYPLPIEQLDKAVCRCATGAIWTASGMTHPEGDDFVIGMCFPVVQNAIGSRIGIGTWNDFSSRTQAEVVAKLREAAALAREQAA